MTASTSKTPVQPRKAPPLRSQGQGGVVLVVGLVILLILTLIGLTAMNATTLQDKMSGNASDRSVAFQAATAAVRAGEERVRNAQLPAQPSTGTSADECNPADGFYQVAACTDVVWKRDWQSGTGTYDYPLDDTKQGPRLDNIKARYIIEQLPSDTDSQGGSLLIGGNETDRRRPVYRITANATYADGSVQATVQTTYQPYQ